LAELLGRLVLYTGVLLALAIVVVSACSARPAAQQTPTLTAAVSALRSATPAPTPSPTATRTASPSPTTTAPPSPGSSPAAACPRVTGGSPADQAQLVALRIAHNPGFDRLVFEFGQSTAPGTFGIPPYTIETASSLSGASGQPVTIAGAALFGIRFQNASTRTPDGSVTYTGSTDLKPGTPLIKEVRLVEDFERVMTWGTGLDHLVCPQVLTLSGPFRVVLDFPTPP
jgi:hypothetical protein